MEFLALPFAIMPCLFGAFVAGVVVLIVWGIFAGQKRQQALQAWAQGRGLAFDATHHRDFDDRFPAFDCLREGDDRYAYNVMTGTWNTRPVLAFDYHYETHSTDSKGNRQTHDHHFSAVVIYSALPLKPLLIRREGLFDKLAGFFGVDDIDFESAEFSRRFHVKAPDRRWAYDVLHARTIEFLLSQPDYSLQFDRECVMAWRGGTFEAAEFQQAADLIAGILDRLPEYVIQQQSAPSSA